MTAKKEKLPTDEELGIHRDTRCKCTSCGGPIKVFFDIKKCTPCLTGAKPGRRI